MTKPKHKQIKINIPTKILFSSYVLRNYHISIVQPIGHLQSKVCSQSQLHHIHEPRQISPANFLVVEKKNSSTAHQAKPQFILAFRFSQGWWKLWNFWESYIGTGDNKQKLHCKQKRKRKIIIWLTVSRKFGFRCITKYHQAKK